MALRRFEVVVLIFLAVLAWEAPLHAYLDPGSGSMLMQLLLGGVAGVAVLFRVAWRGLRDRLGLSRPGPQQEPHDR